MSSQTPALTIKVDKVGSSPTDYAIHFIVKMGEATLDMRYYNKFSASILPGLTIPGFPPVVLPPILTWSALSTTLNNPLYLLRNFQITFDGDNAIFINKDFIFFPTKGFIDKSFMYPRRFAAQIFRDIANQIQ